MTPRRYCAIVGEVDETQKHRHRALFQQKFRDAIAALNDEFSLQLASAFIPSSRNEFQGVLHQATDSYRAVVQFRRSMYPIPCVFGIAVGTISATFTLQALGMDGEVFDRARAALKRAKDSGRCVLYDFDGPALQLTNVAVAFLERTSTRISKRTYEARRMMQWHHRQAAVAKELHITQQAVSKALHSPALNLLTEAEEGLRVLLRALIDT
jgi:hypothetical protein